MSALRAEMSRRRPSVRGAPPGRRRHRDSSTSGGPLDAHTRNPPSGRRWTVLIRLRSESKGTSPRRGQSFSRSSLSRPSFKAASTTAASVGSPTARRAALVPGQGGVGAQAAHGEDSRTGPRPGASTTWVTVILFWVRVPVLSEQMTPAQPRVSTAGAAS